MAVVPASSRTPALQLAYVEFTSSVTVNATLEGTPNDVVTAGALVFDGITKICIECYARGVQPGSTGFVVNNLWDDTTNLGFIGSASFSAAGTLVEPFYVARFLTPTAGSHEYKWRAWRTVADGSILAGSGGIGANLPGYIRISRSS